LHATPVAELTELKLSGTDRCSVAGLVSALKITPIKAPGRNQGKRMASFNLEDQTGSIRAVAFADAFAKLERVLTDGNALLVTAALRSNDGEHVELSVEEATPLEGIEARAATALRVRLDLTHHGDTEVLERLYALMLRFEGKTPVRLHLLGNGFEVEVIPNRVLGVDTARLVPELTTALGPGHVEYLFNQANGGR
jgi:DNA polymerase III alpha subunit